MVHIRIICVGNCKEQHWKSACAEYQKRLKSFCKLEIIEVAESKSDGTSPREISAILDWEGKQILNQISKSDHVIALCIEGKQLASKELATMLENCQTFGKSTIIFIIGGSLGLSEDVKARANVCLSISKMTFPHQLARVLILEQIYRSFTIQHGIRYHK